MTTKLYCYHCKRWLEDEDAVVREEYVGEAHGSPAYEPVLMCKECGNAVSEELYEEGEDDA